jgi:hypothetical protein
MLMAALAGALVRLYELIFWFRHDVSRRAHDRVAPPGIAARREQWRRRIDRVLVHLFG